MFASWMRRWRGEATPRRQELLKDATWRIPVGLGGAVVRVERGLLLVTRQGDLEDHLLGPGDELRLPPRGRSVAWALEPSRFRLAEPGRAALPGRSGQPARAGAGW
jgi:hypothetical protein